MLPHKSILGWRGDEYAIKAKLKEAESIIRENNRKVKNKHYDLTKEVARDVKSLQESHKALALLVEAMIKERGEK